MLQVIFLPKIALNIPSHTLIATKKPIVKADEITVVARLIFFSFERATKAANIKPELTKSVFDVSTVNLYKSIGAGFSVKKYTKPESMKTIRNRDDM